MSRLSGLLILRDDGRDDSPGRPRAYRARLSARFTVDHQVPHPGRRRVAARPGGSAHGFALPRRRQEVQARERQRLRPTHRAGSATLPV